MAIRDRIKVIPEHGKFSVYLDGELAGYWEEQDHADIYVEGIIRGISTEIKKSEKTASDTFDKLMDFWMSEQHEAWMIHCIIGDEYDYIPIAVEIDGKVIPYTSCCETGKDEPWEGALAAFPDYQKVATGTLRGWRRRRTNAEQTL